MLEKYLYFFELLNENSTFHNKVTNLMLKYYKWALQSTDREINLLHFFTLTTKSTESLFDHLWGNTETNIGNPLLISEPSYKKIL